MGVKEREAGDGVDGGVRADECFGLGGDGTLEISTVRTYCRDGILSELARLAPLAISMTEVHE